MEEARVEAEVDMELGIRNSNSFRWWLGVSLLGMGKDGEIQREEKR